MQGRLYIPTSSLNFNNIISSESISPYTFYLNRGYGFRRFEKVIPNNLDNVILLYNKFPDYNIQDERLENFSMVIEICLNSCSAQIEDIGNGVYLCTETIYLNPFDTKFYFNSITELKSTIFKAEPSIEAKFVKLYQNCFFVADKAIKRENYKYDEIQDRSFNNCALEKDIRINKLKGFLYAYIIASNRSYASNIVYLKMHFKQLVNSLSAIIASPNFKISDLQSDSITKLYKNIRYDIELIEGIQEAINRIIQYKKDFYNVENLDYILKNEGLYEFWRIKIKKENNLKAFNTLKEFYVSSADNKIEMLGAYSEYLSSFANKLQKKNELFSSEDIPTITDEGFICNMPGIKPFVVKLLNLYLAEMIQKDVFLGKRYNYALKGGTLFKESLGGKWDGSEEQRYINSLLKNLNEYTAFDINSITNHTLRSFAAFFQKGNIEIEKVEDYLISNGIGDLRIAFALWGVVFGFADMPKTITKELLDSIDLTYKTAIYKGIYKSLFNIQLTGELSYKTEKKNVQELGNIVEYSNDTDKNNGKSWLGKTIDSIKEFIGVNPSYKDLPECLVYIFDSEFFKRIKPIGQDWYKDETLKLWEEYKINSLEFQKSLLSLKDKCPISGTKGHWEKCVKLIEPSKKKTSNKKTSNNKTDNTFYKNSLFSQILSVESSGVFLKDYNFLISNSDFISIASLCSSAWKEDLRWFIDAHNPTHKGYKYYENKPTDNRTIVNQFLGFKKARYKRTEQILKSLYTL